MICRNFLHSLGCSLAFLIMFFREQKRLYFLWSPICLSLLLLLLLVSNLWVYCQIWGYEDYLCFFSTGNFIVLALIFRPFIWVNFCIGSELWAHLHYLYVVIHLSLHHLLETVLSLLNGLVKNQLVMGDWVYF